MNEPLHDDLMIALRRLLEKATAFQRMAQNFDETDTTDRELTVSLQLGWEALQQACPHLEWKGVDLVHHTDPTKQWRCTYCNLQQQRPLEPAP